MFNVSLNFPCKIILKIQFSVFFHPTVPIRLNEASTNTFNIFDSFIHFASEHCDKLSILPITKCFYRQQHTAKYSTHYQAKKFVCAIREGYRAPEQTTLDETNPMTWTVVGLLLVFLALCEREKKKTLIENRDICNIEIDLRWICGKSIMIS